MTISRRGRSIIAQGVPASPGFAIGTVHLLRPEARVIKRRYIAPEESKQEVARLKNALEEAKREILAIKKQVLHDVGEQEARIFDSHILILDDREVLEGVFQDIETHRINAEYAFSSRINSFLDRFENLSGGFLKDRMADLRDICDRVIDILTASESPRTIQDIVTPIIVVAHTLSPSTVSQFNLKTTLGLVTEVGGKTSHVAILARSLEIPSVTGINLQELGLEPGQTIIVDGTAGLVIVNPSLRDIKEYEIKKAAYVALEKELFTLRDLSSTTLDGKYIELSANIELPVEVEAVLQYGADSIGLYRSEFLFLTHETIPDEEHQYQAYKYISERMSPRPVTIRTLDAGGDKIVQQLRVSGEANPFLGWRSIRVCLDNTDIFKTQLRGILRASATGNIRLMFPMISNLNEIREARVVLDEVKAEFEAKQIPYDRNMELGCMIEVPSAVVMAEELSKYVDFFSIGTKDLIQFTLAVDRSNEKIADMFEPHSPAVLRMISWVIKAARLQGIKVSVCGEMAGDLLSAIILIGLGIDELSMVPGSILEMKKMIRSLSFVEAKLAGETILKMTTAEDIVAHISQKFSHLLDLNSEKKVRLVQPMGA